MIGRWRGRTGATLAVCLLAAAAAGRLPAEPAKWKHTSGPWKLWLPEASPARGIFLFNSYGSFKGFGEDPRIRDLGAELGCGVAATDASDYAGAVEALADFSRQALRPDLAYAPLFVFGHSNSTNTMAQFAKTIPDRVVAWVAMKSAFGDQFSVPELYRIPGMVVSGEKDNDYFQDQLARVKKLRKESGVLMHMIVEADGPHWPTDPTFNIMLAFLKSAFLVRVPPDADPRKGRVKLADLPEKSGWLGRNLDGNRIRLPDRWAWEKEVVVKQKLEIAPYAEFAGDRTTASWFPTEDYARKWQEFCLTAAVKDWKVLRAPVKPAAGEARNGGGGIEGAKSERLSAFAQRLAAASAVKPVLDELRTLAGDASKPEDAAEAKRILEAVDRWAKERLDEARAMEEVTPKGAKKLYEAAAKRLTGLEPGDAAAARLKDPTFLRELEAWDRLERMARAEEAVKDVAGAKRVVTDGKFAQANQGPLGTIVGEGRLLVARYADTRAAVSARATLERYGISTGAAK